MSYDNWKTTEPPNEAADEAEATKEAQEEAEAEEEWCHALAMKIQALPRERRLSLERMVASDSMTLRELFSIVRREAKPGMVKVSVSVYHWSMGDLPDEAAYEIYAEEKHWAAGYGTKTPEDALAKFRARPITVDESTPIIDVGF